MELEPESRETHGKLCGVGPVQTVHAVGSDDPGLLHHSLRVVSELVTPAVQESSVSVTWELLQVAGVSVVEDTNLILSINN